MNNFKEFVQLVEDIDDPALLEDFLVGITTPAERSKLLQRVEIVKKLLAGEHHHQIAGDLGVGVATVSRGSRELSQGRFQILRRKK